MYVFHRKLPSIQVPISIPDGDFGKYQHSEREECFLHMLKHNFEEKYKFIMFRMYGI